MSESCFYSISGAIQPLQRARYSGGRFYDSQRNFKMLFKINLERQHGNRELFSGPVEIDATFVMPIPPCYKSKKTSMIDSYHCFKPDWDNMCKMLFDCCNKIIFSDDCIVASVISRKIYGIEPRTDFKVTPLVGKYIKT